VDRAPLIKPDKRKSPLTLASYRTNFYGEFSTTLRYLIYGIKHLFPEVTATNTYEFIIFMDAQWDL
jgi:hypothetical protein